MTLEQLQRLLLRGAPVVNAPIAALARSERFGWLVGRNITNVTYTGRRSGRNFSIPVAYWRSGDDVKIGVAMPDAKSWWRNFLGDGAPLSLRIDGAERSAHAVAVRDEKGRVVVTARLDE